MFRIITERYAVGDVVEQETVIGNRLIRVTNREQDIKNGFPGFDGALVDEDGTELYDGDRYMTAVWGYDHLIVRVVTRQANSDRPSNG
jgi:hypothetical protein